MINQAGDKRTIVTDERTKEIVKKQKISRLLFFTETGEGSCPLACTYCFLAKQGENKKMSVKTLHDAIDWLKEVAVSEPSLHFFGTEPTKQWDLIVEARRYAPDMPMSMTTNGYLLNDERIKWLDENNIKIFIYSIDGDREDNKRRVTRAGKESFDQVAKNLQKVIKSKQGEWVTARGTWYPEDYDLVKKYKALEELGAKSISFVPVITEEWDEAKVAEAYRNLGEYYNFGKSPSRFIEQMLSRIQSGPTSHPGNGCGTGFFSWAISPDGRLSLCQGFEEHSIGTIGSIYYGITNTDPFEKISKAIDEFHTEKNPYPKEQCKTCHAYNYCQGVGFCGSENFHGTGQVNVPPDGYCNHLRGMVTALKYWLGQRQMKQGLFDKIINGMEIIEDAPIKNEETGVETNDKTFNC